MLREQDYDEQRAFSEVAVNSTARSSLKKFARRHLPPSLLDIARTAVHLVRFGGKEWVYCPEGWALAKASAKGWNVAAVANTQRGKWQAFLQLTSGAGPLGISHENPTPQRVAFQAHHTIAIFAFVLTLAARKKDRLSLLDWGSGIGHYYILSRRILPELDLAYYGKDIPVLCAAGRAVLPNVSFFERDEAVTARSYDLVIVSGSLQYSEDWKSTIRMLASCTDAYLYVSRLPVVHHAKSFVVMQRAYAHNYETEYIGWFINREEFLAYMTSLELELVREFIIQEHAFVSRAPEQATEQGFLYRKPTNATSKGDSRGTHSS